MAEKFVRAFIYSIGPDGATGQPIQFSFSGDNADGLPPVVAGLLNTHSYPSALNATTGLYDRLRCGGNGVDGESPEATGVLDVDAYLTAYNGATFDRLRTPNVFKGNTFTAAGNNALWTPAAGKKFRLMKFRMVYLGNSAQAAAGALTALFYDGAAQIAGTAIGESSFVPAAALNTSGALFASQWVDLGNGILSSAANNVLNVNLSTAFTAGGLVVQVAGTEE